MKPADAHLSGWLDTRPYSALHLVQQNSILIWMKPTSWAFLAGLLQNSLTSIENSMEKSMAFQHTSLSLVDWAISPKSWWSTLNTVKRNCFYHLLFNHWATSVHLLALLNQFSVMKVAAQQLSSVVTSRWRDINTEVACCRCQTKNRLQFQNHIKVYFKSSIKWASKTHKKFSQCCSCGAQKLQPRTKELIWLGVMRVDFWLQRCKISADTPPQLTDETLKHRHRDWLGSIQ